MDERQIDISLVIVNYRTRGLLKNCLKGLFNSQQSVSFEVIVVDNDSRDGSVEMVIERFPCVKLIESKVNNGYVAGVNLGLKQAMGRYVLVMNTDLAFFGYELDRFVEWMDSHPKAGMAGPKLLNPNGTWQTSCRTWPTWKLAMYRRTPLGLTAKGKQAIHDHLMLSFDHNSSLTVDWLIGACLIIRREALEAVGGMDQRFFLYFEDVDWARRFWSNGFEVWYSADIALVHYHQQESAGSKWYFGLFNKLGRIHLASGLKYFWKYRNEKKPIHH
ncbi:MAG: glycosyltransferase family 2 protein [bacterium]